MLAMEAVYDGRVFVPGKPVPLKRNQRVVLSFSPQKKNKPEGQSAAALIEFFQNSPLNDAEIVFERDRSNLLRGTPNALFG